MSAAQILREYGAAIRGDWGSIDGRSVRDELDEFADWVAAPNAYPGDAEARERMGICPKGGGHWTDHCDEGYCPESA